MLAPSGICIVGRRDRSRRSLLFDTSWLARCESGHALRLIVVRTHDAAREAGAAHPCFAVPSRSVRPVLLIRSKLALKMPGGRGASGGANIPILCVYVGNKNYDAD